MIIEKTFEGYLQAIHGKQYIGTDDDMPDDYNDWLMAQDIDDIIDWAQRWHNNLLTQ